MGNGSLLLLRFVYEIRHAVLESGDERLDGPFVERGDDDAPGRTLGGENCAELAFPGVAVLGPRPTRLALGSGLS